MRVNFDREYGGCYNPDGREREMPPARQSPGENNAVGIERNQGKVRAKRVI